MKREAILDFFIMNGMQYSTENMEVFDQISGPSIYEVIRVMEGVPLYLEEHLDRMRKSAEILGYSLVKTDEEIQIEILDLIKANHCYHLNVKLVCSDLDKKEQNFLVYFVESKYPEQEVYEKGIHTILFHSERENPNAKILNVSLREKVNAALEESGAYEALLVNEEKRITEGSRSNMFFVQGEKVYTAPIGEVLLGVTRMQIVKICKDLQIDVIEECISVEDLKEMDGTFMTGTSVNVLPITTIDEYKFDSVQNPIIQRIGQSYLKDVEEYIRKRIKK